MISHNSLFTKTSSSLSTNLSNSLKTFLDSKLNTALSEIYHIEYFPNDVVDKINIRLIDIFTKTLEKSLIDISENPLKKSYSNKLSDQLNIAFNTSLPHILTNEFKKFLIEKTNIEFSNSLSIKFNDLFSIKIKTSLSEIIHSTLVAFRNTSFDELQKEEAEKGEEANFGIIALNDCLFFILSRFFDEELYKIICNIIYTILFDIFHDSLRINVFDELCTFLKNTLQTFCTDHDSSFSDTSRNPLHPNISETIILTTEHLSTHVYDSLNKDLKEILCKTFFEF